MNNMLCCSRPPTVQDKGLWRQRRNSTLHMNLMMAGRIPAASFSLDSPTTSYLPGIAPLLWRRTLLLFTLCARVWWLWTVVGQTVFISIIFWGARVVCAFVAHPPIHPFGGTHLCVVLFFSPYFSVLDVCERRRLRLPRQLPRMTT